MDFEIPGRMIYKFRNNTTKQDVLVDMTEQVIPCLKFDLAGQLLRDINADGAYRELMKLKDDMNDDDLDYMEGIVVVPEECAGMRFGDYVAQTQFDGLNEAEKAQAIDDAVAEFSAALDADDIDFEKEIIGDTSFDEVDARSMIELSRDVRSKMAGLVQQAIAYRVTHQMAHYPLETSDVTKVMSRYGVYLVECFGAMTLDALDDCADSVRDVAIAFDGKLGDVLESLPENISEMNTCTADAFLPDAFYLDADGIYPEDVMP